MKISTGDKLIVNKKSLGTQTCLSGLITGTHKMFNFISPFGWRWGHLVLAGNEILGDIGVCGMRFAYFCI